MAKLDRKDVKIFAENSKETLITEFRSENSTGDTASFSRDPDVIQNENYSQGWVNDSNNLNTKIYGEDLNAVSYVLSYLLKYLYENGIAEWKNTTTYCQNSISKIDDTLYISLQDNNLGNDPINTVGYWRAVVLDTITSVLAGNGADIVKAISGNHITFKSLSVDGYGSLQDNGDNINIHVLGGSGIIDAYWGQIQGTLTNQADLIEALGDKQDNLTFDTPLSKDVNNEVSISTADTSTTGALTSTDWNTFSGKANTQKVVADTESTIVSLALESNTLYTFSRPLTSLTIESIPSDNYDVELQFMTSITGFSLHASVLNNKWLGNTPTFRNNYDSYVIVIKNGYAVCNNTFTNNRVFQDYISLKSTYSTDDVELANFDTRFIIRFRDVFGGYSFGLYSFYPSFYSPVDLGSSENKFNNLYLSGTANVGALTSSGAISGTTGTFSNSVISSNNGFVFSEDTAGGLKRESSGNIILGGHGSTITSTQGNMGVGMSVYNPNSGSPSNYISFLLLSSGTDHTIRSNLTNGSINLGTDDYPWKSFYSLTGNFSSDVNIKQVLPYDSTSNCGVFANRFDFVCGNHGNFSSDCTAGSYLIYGTSIGMSYANPVLTLGNPPYIDYKCTSSHNFYINGVDKVQITNDTLQPITANEMKLGTNDSYYYMTNSMRFSCSNGSDNMGGHSFAISANKTLFLDGTSQGIITTNASDRRIKYNIDDLNYGLNDLLQLKTRTFSKYSEKNPIRAGFIAQEVLDVFPEAVEIPEDTSDVTKDMYGLDIFSLLALNTKAIQELNAKVEELESKIKELKK